MKIRFIPSSWKSSEYWMSFGFSIATYYYKGDWSINLPLNLGRKTYNLRITNMSNG